MGPADTVSELKSGTHPAAALPMLHRRQGSPKLEYELKYEGRPGNPAAIAGSPPPNGVVRVTDLSRNLRSLNQGEGRRAGQSGYDEDLRRCNHRAQWRGARGLLSLWSARGLHCATRAPRVVELVVRPELALRHPRPRLGLPAETRSCG